MSVSLKDCYITLITTSFSQYIYKNISKLISFSLDSWLQRPHPCFVRNKLLIEKQLINIWVPSSPCFSSSCPLLPWTGIRAWRTALSQAGPSSPATTQYTSEAVTTSKEWLLLPGDKGTESWAGPRTCSTSDRAISWGGGGGDREFHHFYRKSQKSGHVCVSWWGALPCSTWCCSRSGTEWCSSSPGSSSDASSENTHISNSQVLKGAICQISVETSDCASWRLRIVLLSPEVSVLTG